MKMSCSREVGGGRGEGRGEGGGRGKGGGRGEGGGRGREGGGRDRKAHDTNDALLMTRKLMESRF